MLLAKPDGMGWFRGVLLQIPDLEVLRLVYRKELTDPSCEPRFSLGQVLISSCRVVLIEVQLTPLDLGDGALTLLIPNSQRTGELSTVEAKWVVRSEMHLPNGATGVGCQQEAAIIHGEGGRGAETQSIQDYWLFTSVLLVYLE